MEKVKEEGDGAERSAGSSLSTLIGSALADLERVPEYEANPDAYKDWGQDTDFKLKTGRGECAGPST